MAAGAGSAVQHSPRLISKPLSTSPAGGGRAARAGKMSRRRSPSPSPLCPFSTAARPLFPLVFPPQPFQGEGRLKPALIRKCLLPPSLSHGPSTGKFIAVSPSLLLCVFSKHRGVAIGLFATTCCVISTHMRGAFHGNICVCQGNHCSSRDRARTPAGAISECLATASKRWLDAGG